MSSSRWWLIVPDRPAEWPILHGTATLASSVWASHNTLSITARARTDTKPDRRETMILLSCRGLLLQLCCLRMKRIKRIHQSIHTQLSIACILRSLDTVHSSIATRLSFSTTYLLCLSSIFACFSCLFIYSIYIWLWTDATRDEQWRDMTTYSGLATLPISDGKSIDWFNWSPTTLPSTPSLALN